VRFSELRWNFANDFEPPAVPTAIVFVHGYLAPLPNAYWLGSLKLMHDLKRRDVDLRVVRAPVTGPVAKRAGRLAREFDATRADRIVLVGHSMGGLDARYAARHFDAARRITDVITLGTPHHGTMLADLVHRLRHRLPAPLREIDQGGLADLTRAAARRFNDATPDRDDVRYHAICGRIPPRAVPILLQPFARRLQSHEGDNDSLVAVSSARWGDTLVVDDADHWALIGLEWVSGADLRHRFARLRDTRRPLAVLRRRLRQLLADPV
jgi:pimeloyl-ACP methyl ester carboxylesterase